MSQSNGVRVRCLTGLALVGLSCGVSADQNLFDLPLNKLLKITIEGSTLTEQSIRDVPASVTVFAQEDIDKLGYLYLHQLMNLVPGFQVVRDADNSLYSTASARGIRIGSNTSEILLVVDGQRLNIPRHGGIGSYLEMPLYNVERIEFIRGPGGAIYGSNALMGTINIVTQSQSRKIRYRYDNFDGNYLSGLFHANPGGIGIQLGASFTDTKGDDFWLPTGEAEVKQSNDAEQLSQLSFDMDFGDTSVYFDSYRTQTEYFYVAQYFSPETNRWLSQTYSAGVQHSFTLAQWQSNWHVGYVEIEERARVQHFDDGYLQEISSPSSNAPAVSQARSNEYEVRLENHNQWSINGRSQIMFGFELRDMKVTQSAFTTNYDLAALRSGDLPIRYYGENAPVSPILPKVQQKVMGLYGQIQHQSKNNVAFTLGARFDDYPDANFSQLSPRLGMVYSLNGVHSFKFLYGSAFRAPSIAELYSSASNFVVGDAKLQPETVTSLEAIWRMDLKKLNISLGLFKNAFDKAIVQQLDTDRERVFVNSSLDDSQGVELELNYDVNRNISFQLNGSKLISNDGQMFREANDLLAMISQYQSVRWDLNWAVHYVGSRRGRINQQDLQYNYFSPYWSSSMNFIYRLSDQLQLSLSGYNLGDKTIRYPSQTAIIPDGIPARGRELALGLEIHF